MIPTDVLRFERHTLLPASPEEVWEWHTRPGAFAKLAPPGQKMILHEAGAIQNGSRTVFDLMIGPLPVRWVAEHRDVEPPRRFRDIQVRGPFSQWRHTHRFETLPDGGCRLVDQIDIRLPGGRPTKTLFGWLLRRRLEAVFEHRERVLLEAFS